uniref:Uncharacterized protein n=1 Tax=Acrobeloides nanus TaxID=290746 RepID=A0A914EGW9_9BILA
MTCLFSPHYAVAIKRGECTIDVLTAWCLTLLFWLPGFIFAVYICFYQEERNRGGQQITVITSSSNPAPNPGMYPNVGGPSAPFLNRE